MSAGSSLSMDQARNDFSESKLWWKRGLIIQVALMAAAVAGALVPVAWVAVLTGLLAVFGTASLYACRKFADEAFERAEAIRRRVLLQDGLGDLPSPLDVARLRSESSLRRSSDPVPAGSYYNSNLPPGARRLAHSMWESAHFTGQQAKRVAEHCGLATVIGSIIVLALFYVMLSGGALGASDERPWVAQNGSRVAAAGGAVLSLFGLGTLADLWRNFRSLAVSAEQTCARCAALVSDGATKLNDVLPVLEDYNCTVARAAPLPTYVWRSLQKQLSETWEVVRTQVK